ncbi:neuromedin U, partial [Cyanobium sp. Aljojuca 7D2]|nr:neuromedin U [Cyanobium sp. Aljojuca 7D2]
MARLPAALALAGLLPGLLPAAAQPEAQTEALAAEAQNPIANLISVPFQNNLTPGMGPNQDQTLNVLNIQPVVPFA